MPVGLVSRRQCPGNAMPGQSAGDVRILINVLRIIVVYETVVPNRTICNNRDCDEKDDRPHTTAADTCFFTLRAAGRCFWFGAFPSFAHDWGSTHLGCEKPRNLFS